MPDQAEQLRLVDVALRTGGDELSPNRLRLLKGLAEYRRGHDAAAVACLEQSRPYFVSGVVPAKATATLLLAMAHHRLGHAEQARGLFEDARRLMDDEMPGAGIDDLANVNIEEWLICHVIRREAEAVFAGG
jgi:hypothetical protein